MNAMPNHSAVALVRTESASYTVKRISAAPETFVAFVTAPGREEEHLHRDGRSLPAALLAISQHIDHTAATVAHVVSLFDRRRR